MIMWLFMDFVLIIKHNLNLIGSIYEWPQIAGNNSYQVLLPLLNN